MSIEVFRGLPVIVAGEILGVANSAALPNPSTLPDGSIRFAQDSGSIYKLYSGAWIVVGSGGGSGTVSSVSVTTANGVSGSVANATTTPAISLTLGAITPTSVVTSGNVTSFGAVSGVTSLSTQGFIHANGLIDGLNLSGTNTGDQTITLTGDVTGSGTGSFVATIPSGAITDAKAAISTKPPVTVVATTNQALSGTPTIDGQTTTAGLSIVLLTAQSTASQNGPWIVQSSAWTRPSWYASGNTTQAFQFITTLVRLGNTYSGTTWRTTTAAPITIDTTATTWAITKLSLNSTTASQSSVSTNGFLSSVDWSTFNNKADNISSNFITNPIAEVDLAGWNLYNNSGNTAFAYILAQDITWIAATGGNAGNGINIEYIYNASFASSTPNINVINSTHVQVQWNNGPTVANNPTATQLKAAWDAVPAALAIATSAITGTASNRQYITGSNVTANGGDAAPINGTGGSTSGVTFTRSTTSPAPLVGTASFDLGKSATNEQGQGVSTDFAINNADKGQKIQISFYYNASSGMVLGSSSDVQMFIYDITNAALIPLTPQTVAAPVSTTKTYVGTFIAAANSINYRLIYHMATSSSTAWDLTFDNVTATDIITPGAATQVPRVTVLAQPINGSVTDHMVVMRLDGGSSWIPATITGATTTDVTSLLGFATNIVGLLADIVVAGSLDGFSFGPFVGYNQYIDNIAGGLSPLPSPFTDKYVSVGKGISSTVLDIEFIRHVDAIGVKGGLLTNSGVNDGTGDTVLVVGANGNALIANSGAANGINWAPSVVAAAPFTYTLATRTLTAATATNSVAGFLSAADHTTFAAAAPLASPVFTGTPSLPTGTTGITQTAADSTTKLATTAFVTTANNLKAPLATPTFTGDVNSSTGNVLISTIGKGIQVKMGTNAKIGTAILVTGTKTIANTSVTANSRIFLSVSATGGTPSTLSYTKAVGTSFTITSANALDTSTIDWYIVESIP